MSITEKNDLILQCENQFWVYPCVIVSTKVGGSLPFNTQASEIYDSKPEIFHNMILDVSNWKTITSCDENFSLKEITVRHNMGRNGQKGPYLALKGLEIHLYHTKNRKVRKSI